MRDSDSAILRLILATLGQPSWKTDLPRVYQGALARQRNGSWLLTNNNAWGSVVLRKMKAAYSKEKVQGRFEVSLGDKKRNLRME